MITKDLVLYFFVGMFLFNALPHLISGVIGNKHMTPISKDSSAVLNVLWGFFNIAVAVLFLGFTRAGIQPPPVPQYVIAVLLGVFVLSLIAASMFSNPNAKMPWWK